jgi:uncharacterized paraquat-inducible protein A
MLATYAHLDGTYVDGVMLERAGIVQTEKKKKSDSLKAEQCPHCHTINPPGAQFCTVCGRGLTEEAITQIEQERGAIRAAGAEYIKLSDVQEYVNKAVKEALAGKK